MTLRDIVDRLDDMVELQVVIDDCGDIIGAFNGVNSINHYRAYCGSDVISIDTDAHGKLIVTVDANS